MSEGNSPLDNVKTLSPGAVNATQYHDRPECNWRRTFYPNACHFCKNYGDLLEEGAKLKRCAGCGLIAYCSKEHQQLDWPKHRDICKVVSKILKKSSSKSIFQLMGKKPITDEKWINLKVSLLQWIRCKVGRELERFEREMFLFPRNCGVCHDTDPEVLEECEDCPGYSFCERHVMGALEEHFCSDMLLCKEIDVLEDESLKTLPPKVPKYLDNVIKLRGSVTDILESESSDRESRAAYTMPVIAGHMDLISDPVTLLYALRLLNFRYQGLLRIHVIGATAENVRSSWHTLLHHEEQILDHVLVTFIGKNVPDVEEFPCDECTDRDVLISFQHQRRNYGDFVGDGSFIEPHVIVGFNMGVPDHEEFAKNEEAWKGCLEAVAQRNCPVVFTSHYAKAADELEDRVEACSKRFKKFYRRINTFSSLRPRRNYELEKAYYRNHIIMIYRLEDN